jgi:hypothetical protein
LKGLFNETNEMLELNQITLDETKEKLNFTQVSLVRSEKQHELEYQRLSVEIERMRKFMES